MKKYLVILIILLYGFFIAKAQNVPVFKQKMYVDSLNRLYVNKDQPVYLWLSTSMNKDSAVLLQSHESKDYVNPFYFDSEGKNTVRTPSKVDKKTRKVVIPKSDIIFEVYADGLAPISYRHFSGAKKHIKHGKTYYSKSLKVKLTAVDGVSGVKDIYYSINGNDFQVYKQELVFEKEGEIKLKYFAVDHVGNVEKIKTTVFVIDLSPPVIKKTKTGTIKGNVLSKDTKIVLSATDELSGLRAIYYSIDGKSPIKYTSPLPAYILGEGEHKFDFYAIDNVGNTSINDDRVNKEYSGSMVYDNTGPDVEIVPTNGCTYKNNNILFLSPDCKINFDASDDYTAVKKVEYALNSTTNFKEYTTGFSMLETGKNYALYYRAVDEVNNYSKLHVQKIIVDDKAPTSWIKFGTPHLFDRDTFFISEKTSISILANDKLTGINKTEYKINESDFIEYKEKFYLNNYGLNIIKFHSIDNVNNREKLKTSSVVLDNLPPKIFVRFSIESVGEKTIDSLSLQIYPKHTHIYIAATDKNSGTAKILYSINNDNFVDYSVNNNILKGSAFTKTGKYKLTIKAIDKLGNQAEKEIYFLIE